MLTEREKQIFRFIIEYIEKKRYVPTVREISAGIGLKSIGSTHRNLQRLEKKGFIERKENYPRAMRVLKSRMEAYDLLAGD